MKTPWSGKEDLYLRKEFKFEYKVREVQSASLLYAIDDDIEVWLNGTRILKVAHEGQHEYLTVDVTKEFKRLVRETGRRNLIAVKAHNNRGGCYVDVGLEVVLADSDRTSSMKSARNPEKQDGADTKEVRLIPTADREQTEWRYCFDSPAGEWVAEDYNDKGWMTGKSLFGGSECGSLRKGSHWSVENVYLRKTIECNYESSKIIGARIRYAVDDDFELFLNGELVFKGGLTRGCYEEAYPVKAISEKLKKGRNVFAVRAHNRKGPQYVDVGVMIEIAREASPIGESGSCQADEAGSLKEEVADGNRGENDVEPKFQRSCLTKVPSKSAVNRAVDTVVELCGDDVKAAKEGKISNLQLASKFLEYSRKTDDLALKFVLLRNAFRQFVLANKFDSARELIFKVIDTFGGHFAAGVAEHSVSFIEKGVGTAKTGRSAAVLQSVVGEMRTAIAEVDKAEKALKRASANFGERKRLAYNSAIIGNWFEALSAYAELEGQPVAMAKWELAYPKSAEGGFSAEIAGDRWWDMSAGKDDRGLAFHSFTSHAAFWYRKALEEGKMDELKKALVKNRLKQLVR